MESVLEQIAKNSALQSLSMIVDFITAAYYTIKFGSKTINLLYNMLTGKGKKSILAIKKAAISHAYIDAKDVRLLSVTNTKFGKMNTSILVQMIFCLVGSYELTKFYNNFSKKSELEILLAGLFFFISFYWVYKFRFLWLRLDEHLVQNIFIIYAKKG